MSSARAQESITKLRIAPPDLRLVNWPLRDSKLSSLLACAAVVGAVIVANRVSGSLAMAILAGVALVLTLWRLWLPVTYEFGASGIMTTVAGRRARIPWMAVRACEVRKAGVLLRMADGRTPTATPGRFIAWNQQKRELLALLDYYVGTRSNLPTTSASTATVPAVKQAGGS